MHPTASYSTLQSAIGKLIRPVRNLGLWCALIYGFTNVPSRADEVPPWQTVYGYLESKCISCHGEMKHKGGVNLERLAKDPTVSKEYDLWTKVQTAVSSGEMPPEDAKALGSNERRALLGWVEASLDAAAQANAGDPGRVALRRLTNSEYDYAIRDLSGLELGLSKEFSPDGGGGEGFSNIGEALFVSPQHLDKFFAAARKLSEHATVLPGTGIQFRPQHLGVRGPAQVKSDAESDLFFWYQKASGPYLPKDGEDLRQADYMTACWKWKHRAQTGAVSLEALAREQNLALPFLENWWNLLQNTEPASRFLDLTRLPWRQLSGPSPDAPHAVPDAVGDQITRIAEDNRSWFLPPKWSVLRAQQDSDELKTYPFEAKIDNQKEVHLVIGDLGDGNRGDVVVVDSLEIQRNGKKQGYIEWISGQKQADLVELEAAKTDPSKAPRTAELEQHIAAAERFLALLGRHPQGREADANSLVLVAPTVLTLPLPTDAQLFRAKGRLDLKNPELEFASAQWMASVGPPRDPSKILPGVITVWKRQTAKQKEVGGDFGKMKEAFAKDFEERLAQVAANRFRGEKGGAGVYYLNDTQLRSLLTPAEDRRLKNMKEDWRFVSSRTIPKNLHPEWDQKVKVHLESFAEKAWRRPLTEEEKGQLGAVYDAGVNGDLDRESAAREVIVRTLVAPAFLFKLEQAGEPGVRKITPFELASRLSFFLWSTIPDELLFARARDGSLAQPSVLQSETLRMLKDPKATALAREFAGQWFQFQGFDSYTKTDAEKFPEFTPELRGDLHGETVAFFTHLVRENQPVQDILSADYTFLNERVARHYGIPNVQGEEFRLVKVGEYSRGGLLGMGALLTRTSYPHRTSPVLRGNWVLRSILGTPTPPPPNDVPKLDETAKSTHSLRERLESHRADRACAVCHDKIDPLGFALERFDPIGRMRTNDETGGVVDDSARFRDHTFAGLKGLKGFLKDRNTEFNAVFSRKLLGYALGRPVLPTDKPLLERMKKELRDGDATFAGAVLAVVESPQFQFRRDD
jgi:hypothetical protein